MGSLQLSRALAAWNTPDFGQILKQEIEAAGAAALPLQRALSYSSHALEGNVTVMFLGANVNADIPAAIQARIGVFFSGIVAGCSCADDPTPVEAQNEYCEMELVIDQRSATTTIRLADD